jgi:hypothetical protein
MEDKGCLSFSLKTKAAAQGSDEWTGALSLYRAQELLLHLTERLHITPQAPQNIATDDSVHSLFWWNKFLMHDAFGVKKTNR